MIKAAISLTNYARNPEFYNNTQTSLVLNESAKWSVSYPSDGTGQDGMNYSRITAVVTAPTGNNTGWFYNYQIATAPGDVLYISCYIRSSFNTSFRVGMENKSATNVQLANVYGSPISLTAGVWTRVTAAVTVPATGTQSRPVAFFQGGITIGDTFDFTGFMTTKNTASLTDYKSANSSGWSWTGTVGNSESVGPYFIDSSIKANVIINQAKNPALVGTGTIATGYSGYSGSGTPTGTYSLSSGVQTITATSIIGGNHRFGVSNTGGNRPLGMYIEPGQMLYIACDIDTSGLAVGTSFGLYAQPQDANNVLLAFPETTFTSTSQTRAELRYQAPAGKIVTSTDVYFWVKTLGSDWTGTSTVKVSNIIVLKSIVYDALFTYPYFDGNTTNCIWTGTANASASKKPDWITYNVKRYDGSAWVS